MRSEISMRTARLLLCIALTVVAAGPVATTSWADPAINPFQTLPSPSPLEFQDYSQLFTRILADRALSTWLDESLLLRIQADSRIDRVHDRSPEPIEVVRVNLRNPDGTSRVRSGNGDFPFYVLRETPKGLVLMGQMFGSAYQAYFRGQHLEFRVEQHFAVNKTIKCHAEGTIPASCAFMSDSLPLLFASTACIPKSTTQTSAKAIKPLVILSPGRHPSSQELRPRSSR